MSERRLSKEERRVLRRDLDDVISSNATWAEDPITSQVDAALDVAEEHFARLLTARLAGWALYAEFVDRERRQTGWTLADQAARLAAVEALHVRDGAPNTTGGLSFFCAHCSEIAQEYVNWPCRTIAALHPDPSEATWSP
jgi:hypothetical protein